MSEVTFIAKLRFLFEPHRFKVAHGGRGSGKSVGYARALALLGTRNPLRILCARETMRSLKESSYLSIKDEIEALGLEDKYEFMKEGIRGRNGTIFSFSGLQDPASIKSMAGYDIVWVEEAQSVSKKSWDMLIPTFRKDDARIHGDILSCSEVWVTFNSRMASDDTYKRFVVNPPQDAHVVRINWQDNPWFPEVLRKAAMSLREENYEEYLHIWEGHCINAVQGAIYGNEIRLAEADGRIGQAVPINRKFPVQTVWDLGYGDMTAIWFVQAYDGWYNFVDYHEDEGKTISDYLVVLQQKNYLYGIDWLPYDGVDMIIHTKLAGNRDLSIEQIMREAGRNVRIVPKVRINVRINAGRTIFGQCRFDASRCTVGVDHLRSFQLGERDEKTGLRPPEPLHDIHSHGSEAFTRAGQALQMPKLTEKKKYYQLEPIRKAVYRPFA